MSDWKTGKHTPDPVNIKKLANFFNVPISYFYDDGRTNISDFKSAADMELDDYIEMLKKLPPERRKSIYEQIEFQNTKEANSRS
ncbi:MAG: helix-turn-helix transcriptional regulator [Lachnospiraceae bacterium]|nr:helix-turn-helix transcriptional regulator [Lachnospiraceae bacterium]